MDEISNKTLATLLVVAIVISLAGTFFAMRGVSQVTSIVTGAQTASGTAKVNISEQTAITLMHNTVDFGTGRRTDVTPVSVPCNLSSNETAAPSCWNATGSGYSYLPDPDFVLENTGNVNVNVTINGTASADFFNSCTVTTILGGTPAYYWASRASGQWAGDDEAGCESGNVVAWQAFDGTNAQLICANLTYDDAVDLMNISIRLDIPSGPSGECEDNGVEFTALRNY